MEPAVQTIRAVDALSESVKGGFLQFLETYRGAPSDDPQSSQDTHQTFPPYYLSQLQDMKLNDRNTLFVDFNHIMGFESKLADLIAQNFYRVEPGLRKAVQEFIKQHQPDYSQGENKEDKEFWVSIYNLPTVEKLRDLKTERIGKLVAFSGTVTRTSEVRPELYLGAFKCLDCNTVCRGIEQQFKYSPPVLCANPTCGNKRNWTLVREESTFVDWQRIKVQESSDEVPAGSLPRTIDVIMRNDSVESAKAGDKMVFTGSLVVVPDVAMIAVPGERVSIKQGNRNTANTSDGFTGLRNLGSRELTYRLMFIASAAQTSDERYGMVNIRSDDDPAPEEVLAQFEPSHVAELKAMKADPKVYTNLATSIAPSVYGHTSIKQAILLMLFGGIHKTTHEGINLRGDINVAIIGDPSCAKSQLLKYVSNFLPRAVYTSGKSSTAAGLTASVVKEPENGEFTIEAGALMLADNGICCIDEFDKMDVKDQVAIHEAMEQQTISITKAGIQATLNARASVLAAANPIGGRYDRSKPLKYNISLPPAILSRFDLLHVMTDDADDAIDRRVATHILATHRLRSEAFKPAYATEQIQRYIKYARAIKPAISLEAKERLVKAYKELRGEDAAPGSGSAYRITVRQLEALVRLSEAMARVYCCNTVRPEHVDEAKRLLRASILKLEQSDVELDELAAPVGLAGDEDDEDEGGAAAAAAAARGGDDVVAAAAANLDAPGSAGKRRAASASPGAGSPPGSAAKRARRSEASTADAAAAEASAAAAAAVEAPAAAAAAAEGGERRKVKITAAKFEYVKMMLAAKLLQAEEERRAGGEGEGEAGISQRDLVEWYLKQQAEAGTGLTLAGGLDEEAVVHRIIAHLIKQGNTLVVVSQPEQRDDEDLAEFAERFRRERFLALHVNYTPDQ